MSARQKLKKVIAVLCMLLCVEVGFFVFQMNSSANRVSRNLDLGNKYLLAEDYDSAISAFSKAIEIDSMNADAYIGRGDAYKAKGDYESAWADYEKAQELSGNEDILREKIGATEITVVSEDGEGVDGAAVKLTGSGHSYEFMTDTTGHISEVIFPEKYNVEVVKEDYELAEIELSAEEGGSLVGQIQLKSEIDKKKYALIEEYKSFISSYSNAKSYMIYDIDKDDYPELFFYEVHSAEREAFCDIYYYSEGIFKLLDRTYGPGFWHVLPTYASYPKGNGIVEYGAVKGREFVDIDTWNEGVCRTETVYNSEFSIEGTKYYKDTDDHAFVYQDIEGNPINHQFYQSETSCPYFEGSYLLAQSARDNFTALYEAFGVEENDVSVAEQESTSRGVVFQDVILLSESENTDISSSTDGQIYGVQYSAFEIDDEVVELNLSVNNNSETFRLQDERVYFASIESVYVADINATDAYGNFIVVLVGEDDETETFIFSFNNSEIHQISDYRGRLMPESINGEGTVLLTDVLTMPVSDYGCFAIRPEMAVNGLNSGEKTIHCGRYKNKNFDEGVWPTIDENLTVYSDTSRTQVAGIIPAWSLVEWRYNRNSGVFARSGDVEGYVTIDALRAASM